MICILGGNAIGIAWKKPFYKEVDNWVVFVHDVHEHPLLHIYAMEQLPYTTIIKQSNDESNLHIKIKKKAQILPTKFVQPNTRHHPCNGSLSYSRVRGAPLIIPCLFAKHCLAIM